MSHDGRNPKVREIAERLVAYEATAEASFDANTPATFHVCEKLRRPLSNLAGTNGFRLLLSRALKLAQHDAQVLSMVQVKADGSLDGLGKIARGEAGEAGASIITQLIGLLVTFIGERLTLRLLHDVWPDLPGFDIDSGREEAK
jgi:hypothetical protein